MNDNKPQKVINNNINNNNNNNNYNYKNKNLTNFLRSKNLFQ